MPLPHIYPSLAHLLADAAERAPEREALVCGEERLNYGEYLACSGAFARELLEHDLRGERVALVLGNSPDICIAMFGVHAAGAVAVPLNPDYTAHELEPILADAAPRGIVYDETSRAAVEPLADRLGIRYRVHAGEGGRRLTAARAGDASLPEPFPGPGDLATIQYTGGTTGRAKGAMLSHHAITVNIAQREAMSPTESDVERILAVLPLFHVYGVSMCLHNAPYCRGTLVMVSRYHPERVIDALERERITLLAGSPTLFTGLLAFAGFPARSFPALKLSYSGGASLPEEVLRRWEAATGTPIYEGYGQSEAGPVISFNPVGRRKTGSVGVPLPETELQIVDVETGERVLPAGERGEIRLRGPQVMSGYWNNAEETARTLRDGWLYTGDIGELDEDGYVYIRDRKKDMVIVSGFNVYPREVEEVLYQHPAVAEVAVVGVPDAYRGELVKAYVVPAAGAQADAEALRAHCAERLIRYKVPAIIELVDALPRTGAGKIDKKALRART